MKLKSRQYQDGDEVQVNKLYKLLTNRDRSLEEYKWEWLETWDGQGNMYYLFDEDRPKDDQLICQYSLIPTPLSVFGKYIMAGKTENCMSHPDYRGKGIYIPHEKKYFEDAKKRFKIFFTTTGNTGAAWAVRMKLGYLSLDLWVNYYFYINYDYLQSELSKQLKKKLGKLKGFSGFVSLLISKYFQFYSFLISNNKKVVDVYFFNESEVDLKLIEDLWGKNKYNYGISTDRNASYLDWRINQNPHHEHTFIYHYKNAELIGYIIFYLDQKNIIRIVDILVDNLNKEIFKNLILNLKKYAIANNVNSVSCSIMLSNKKMKNIFHNCGFIGDRLLKKKYSFSKTKEIFDFYAYLPEKLKDEESIDPKNWYVTDLLKEGR
jgi:GNAT acetyltransferase-like protein/acetyltransferase (GNAT) family protein